MKDSAADLKKALTAGEEELKSLVYHPSGEVLEKVFLNPNLNEDHVFIIANRKNLPHGIFELVFSNKRWKECYRIVSALSKNPRTPEKISMQLLKSLRIMDIAGLTRNSHVRISVRSKAELMICEKIPALPLGVKISIARKAGSNVLEKLLEDGIKEVVNVCLDNPLLTEGDICKTIHMQKTPSNVIRMIAGHPKWSRHYEVQKALVRNNHSPLSIIVHFFERMMTQDLKELYEDPNVPSCTKPFLYRELFSRNAIVG